MRILLDENLSISHKELLLEAGYEVERVTEVGLSGKDDSKVWEFARKNDYFFITLDKDFSDIRSFPPGTHSGIMLLRIPNKSLRATTNLLQRVLSEYNLNELEGCLIVADLQKTRIRRPQ
jgi:predicted nuclease of predicted toxin-antitoxin system